MECRPQVRKSKERQELERVAKRPTPAPPVAKLPAPFAENLVRHVTRLKLNGVLSREKGLIAL
jgi:hypothetical protein